MSALPAGCDIYIEICLLLAGRILVLFILRQMGLYVRTLPWSLWSSQVLLLYEVLHNQMFSVNLELWCLSFYSNLGHLGLICNSQCVIDLGF